MAEYKVPCRERVYRESIPDKKQKKEGVWRAPYLEKAFPGNRVELEQNASLQPQKKKKMPTNTGAKEAAQLIPEICITIPDDDAASSLPPADADDKDMKMKMENTNSSSEGDNSSSEEDTEEEEEDIDTDSDLSGTLDVHYFDVDFEAKLEIHRLVEDMLEEEATDKRTKKGSKVVRAEAVELVDFNMGASMLEEEEEAHGKKTKKKRTGKNKGSNIVGAEPAGPMEFEMVPGSEVIKVEPMPQHVRGRSMSLGATGGRPAGAPHTVAMKRKYQGNTGKPLVNTGKPLVATRMRRAIKTTESLKEILLDREKQLHEEVLGGEIKFGEEIKFGDDAEDHVVRYTKGAVSVVEKMTVPKIVVFADPQEEDVHCERNTPGYVVTTPSRMGKQTEGESKGLSDSDDDSDDSKEGPNVVNPKVGENTSTATPFGVIASPLDNTATPLDDTATPFSDDTVTEVLSMTVTSGDGEEWAKPLQFTNPLSQQEHTDNSAEDNNDDRSSATPPRSARRRYSRSQSLIRRRSVTVVPSPYPSPLPSPCHKPK